MTSLSEVYRPDAEFQTSLRRLYAGLGLFAAGVLLVVVSIVVGATEVVEPLTTAREWAGILAGIGVPAVFLGIFAILPSGRNTRIAAGIGAALSLLGVALFAHAFPCQWSGTNCLGPNQSILTLPVALIYFVGAGTTLWCLFTGIANFKARNNPGGTARVEVTAQGETRVIEVPKSELSKFSGSMGVLGDPTEDIEAPDRPGARGGGDDGSSVFRDDDSGVVSDGGATSNTITDVSDDVLVQGGDSSSDSGAAGGSGTVSTGGSSSPGSKPARRDADASTTDSRSTQSTGSVDSVPESSHQRSPSGSSTGRSPRRDEDWEPSGMGPDSGAKGGPDRDSYCGSCRHFEYLQTEQGMQPYCHAHNEFMDDMEACDDYSPRTE
jgi:cytochrome c biogenesis protein CcdA